MSFNINVLSKETLSKETLSKETLSKETLSNETNIINEDINIAFMLGRLVERLDHQIENDVFEFASTFDLLLEFPTPPMLKELRCYISETRFPLILYYTEILGLSQEDIIDSHHNRNINSFVVEYLEYFLDGQGNGETANIFKLSLFLLLFLYKRSNGVLNDEQKGYLKKYELEKEFNNFILPKTIDELKTFYGQLDESHRMFIENGN